MNLSTFSALKTTAELRYFADPDATHADAADYAVRRHNPELADKAKDCGLIAGTLAYWEYVRTQG